MNANALKERLKAIAKEKGITFNEAWKQLLLERFLARLSHSAHQEKFIFKGGLLLAQYLEIGRETTDIDFLATQIKSEAPAIEAVIREVLAADHQDGFVFSWAGIEELTQPHMAYSGFRVSFDAHFGKMKDKIQVDIGLGDLVEPVENDFRPYTYRGKPIFAGEITLLTYPVETIFAEKLETIISKGPTNSRMKDYHDVTLMIREPGLIDVQKLKATIAATFSNRGTALRIPLEFDAAGMATLQRLWGRHLNGLGEFKKKLRLPEEMADLLLEVNAWLTSKGFPS